MTPERHKRLKEVFDVVVNLPREERVEYLDQHCGADSALRAEVEALLAAHDGPTSPVLQSPQPGGGDRRLDEARASSLVSKRIGRYHVRRIIASGGMGTVYEAMQESPRRTVALKVMKHGIASRSALRRFEYESQILARLRHPGIAQVYEAGVHEWGDSDPESPGVPYFAMDYIPNAKPITQYAHDKKLSTKDRLELFAKVCEAVHHGHQKGIIHRDLKPGNILVDSHGQPKVIDFGVARATDSDLAVTTLQTDVGQLIGTLQYMSPEQCDADPHDLDTRSDVYALGVVLYELLCEQLPYDVTKVAVYEAARVIREETPPKPSSFNRTLRGDVETITLKAMEKERERRYRSAAELSEDVSRYLRNETIVARPPSLFYQIGTAIRRNRRTAVAAASVLILIMVATGLTVAWRHAIARADQAHQLRLQAHQHRILASLNIIDDSNRAEFQSVIDQITSRIADGTASSQEVVHFTRAIAETVPISIIGSRIQTVSDARATIQVDGYTAIEAAGFGLWFVFRPRVSDRGGDLATHHVTISAMRRHASSGWRKAYSLALTRPGRYVLSGIAEVRLIRMDDPTATVEAGSPPAPTNILSDPVFIPLPEFVFTAVHELPKDYPVPVRDERFIAAFRDNLNVKRCEIVAIDDSCTTVELELMLRIPWPEVPVPLEVQVSLGSSLATWSALLEHRQITLGASSRANVGAMKSVGGGDEGVYVVVTIYVPVDTIRRLLRDHAPVTVAIESICDLAIGAGWSEFLKVERHVYDVPLSLKQEVRDRLFSNRDRLLTNDEPRDKEGNGQ